MSIFGLDTIADTKHWDELYHLLDPAKKSPFFSSGYYRSYASIEDGKTLCFWGMQDEDNFLFYPLIKKSINALGYDLGAQYYDISGAYGYNGPIGKVSDPQFIYLFNTELQAFLQNNRVVTEFVRYCPITGNRKYHNYTQQLDVLDNVFIDLSQGLDTVWSDSFEYRVRKTVRKGESYDLVTHFFRGQEITKSLLEVFFEIYNSTMQRTKADDFYFFDFDFFQNLASNLQEMLLVLITFFEDTPISTELILLDGELAFGFLGGTLSEYYQYKANTFQRWELLKYLDTIGIKKYSMGGGSSRGDSVYNFKLNFAKGCDNPFFIGKTIHNPDIYEQIQEQWKARHPMSASRSAHLLQGYRKLDG
ncbi:MAG: GNAT family N-acetyltransferase [Candidatus Cloacimonetes bacterium]|nr:GNAT family N-acetyltransferase [Candidatus Cloacimonadota bacterium]